MLLVHFHLTFSVNKCILFRVAGRSGEMFFDPLQDTEISQNDCEEFTQA